MNNDKNSYCYKIDIIISILIMLLLNICYQFVVDDNIISWYYHHIIIFLFLNHNFKSYKCKGGIAARASEINTETAYALHLFNTKIPQPIEDLLVLLPNAGVCLVDHQQVSQLNKSIDVRTRIHTCQRIRALISDTCIFISCWWHIHDGNLIAC